MGINPCEYIKAMAEIIIIILMPLGIIEINYLIDELIYQIKHKGDR